MPVAIRILVDEATLSAELADTACGRAIAQRLPITGQANTWGEEIYFDVGVQADLDDTARDVVELGDIGYWPTGRALCLFFGATPTSGPDEIRPASAVNVVGRILSDLEPLKEVKDGASVHLVRD